MSEYITKDSGKRMTFDSGMARDTNEGKLLWHLVFSGPMLKRWAALLTRGAVKYSANNWMKAAGEAERDRFRESAARHFAQWMNGDTDEDHAAAVIFNINGKEYVEGKLSVVNELPPPVEDKTKYDGDWNFASQTPGCWRIKDGQVSYIFPSGIVSWHFGPDFDLAHKMIDAGNWVPNAWPLPLTAKDAAAKYDGDCNYAKPNGRV